MQNRQKAGRDGARKTKGPQAKGSLLKSKAKEEKKVKATIQNRGLSLRETLA